MRTEALVLRTVDFGESDLVVHLLTPDAGRIGAIAKGARRSVKRFAGSLDVLNRVRIELAVRRRPGTLALAELLDRMAPEGSAAHEAAALYGFVLRTLALLEEAEPDARLRVLLELRALDALGLRPELAHCVRCGGQPAAFHVPEGGPVCRACGMRIDGLLPVRRGTLRTLEHALRLEPDRLGRLRLSGGALAEARELVHRFARFHVGLELRSEPVLDSLGLGVQL
jgi:DNA repair protein RecO (recombination protein O)